MGENLHFITNRGKTLKETISNLSTSTQNIYILVGFFYFSGFFKLKEEFKDKNIKILIGLDIDKRLGRFIIEYNQLYEEDKSIADIKAKFYDSLYNAFSFSDNFDSYEIRESFKIFAKKIENGTLEIRKTKMPNHAKLYIFENKPEFSQNGDYPGTIITGSSNLSIEGLEKRFEIDIISREKSYYIEAKKIFDELWQNSIPVATKENFEEFKKEVLDKIWPTSDLPTPYEVYIRVLKEYFSLTKPHIRMPKDINKQMMNLAYQNDAVAFIIDTVKKHNGAIIADVVGLGKSIIASAVAHNLNLDTVIIAPPHLKEQWEYYRKSFKFMGDVYSSGSIEDAVKDYSGVEGRKLIIIDEAHRYRNTETISYNYLWLLCQGNYVLLLTATPFNNTPEDIESLIKLFQSPSRSTLKHIDNLSIEFKRLIKEYSELKKKSKTSKKEEIKKKADEISRRIRYIISPVTIRRTRVDLMKIEKYRKDLEKQGVVFPKVNPPEIISYSFKELDKLYLDTIEKFVEDENSNNCFKAARYKAISYIKDLNYKSEIALKYTDQKTKNEALSFIEQSQKNLSSLIRRIFVKRFESSFGSFSKSIEDYINSHKKIKEYYLKGKIPIYKKIEDIPSPKEIDDLDMEEREELLKKLQELETAEELIWIDSDKLSKDFIRDLDNDIAILEKIKEDWEKYIQNPSQYDFKLHRLIKILEEKINNNEKVIIFSEYSDTVDYLTERLKEKNFRVMKYHSSVKSDTLKDEIKSNFDASLSESQRKNDYDILITTDILSEGINLHRANNIINYDIPYNPTRVIQRIGRVNRISKLKQKDIWIYNFFPTGIGEKHTHIKNISTLKMHMIHFLLGEDMQYLTNEEDIRSFFYEEYKNSSYFEEESWDVKYRNLLYYIEDNHPELFEKACNIPYRTKIKRIKQDNIVLTFARKGENFIFKVAIKDGNSYKIKTLSDEEAIKLFEAAIDEKSFEVSKDFYEIYSQIKKNIFETTSLKSMDRWEREISNKIETLEKNSLQYYPEYSIYISKLKKLIELEVLPEYIIKTIRAMPLASKDAVKELVEKLPEFHIDEVFKRINEYESNDDIIIISEEFSS